MSKAFASSVIEASIESVWPVVRDFSKVHAWLPAAKSTVIEGPADSQFIGTVRSLTMQDGNTLREKLLALSDDETAMSFEIIESPLPVTRYVCKIRLEPITDGHHTYISWAADFDAKDSTQVPSLRQRFEQQVFLPAFLQLKQQFALTS